jgi:hypothetical protein
LDLQLPKQSVSITTVVVSSNLDQGEVHNKHYVIKFVSDLDQSLIGTELTSKLEPAFLGGLRSNQHHIRQKFVEVIILFICLFNGV